MALTGTHAAGDTGAIGDQNLRDQLLVQHTAAIAGKVDRWAPLTAYAVGAQVVNASNDVVKATVAHTSSAAYATDLAKWQLGSTFALPMTTTVVKTTAYTAAANQIVPVDASGAPVTITLPTAPVDKSRVTIKKVDASVNLVTVASAGGDVFNVAAGGTTKTLTMFNQAGTYQYATTGAIWYAVSDDIPLSGLDARFLTPAQGSSTYLLRSKAPTQYAMRADMGKLRAPNAVAGMAIPTYDGGNQLTHSSIVYNPEGWGGFKYWMVATPYAAANSQVENPCIYCANDPSTVGGANGWQVPAGLTNPIEPTPPGGTSYNSDPDLEWGPDGLLYVVWRAYRPDLAVGVRERFMYRTSADGVTWSASAVLMTNDETVTRIVSPSVIFDGTLWRMWTADFLPSPNTLAKRTATTFAGLGTATPQAVTVTGLPGYPATREVWHLDVNKWGDEYHMLINDSLVNQAGSTGLLYVAGSDDGGLTFTCSNTPLIQSRIGAFDASFYRSSMVPALLGDEWGYQVIYCGIAPNGAYTLAHTYAGFSLHKRQVGRTDGLVHGMDPSHVNVLAARVPIAPFVLGDAWSRADAATLGSAESGQAWTVQAGVPGIVARTAYATTAANTKVVVTGISDGYFEIALLTLGISSWLMFRGSDTSNYWRIGFNSGAMKLQKVVAGGVTEIFTPSLAVFVPGARIGVLCNGSAITPYLDGLPITSPQTDVFNQTATQIGWQAGAADTRFGPILARALVGGV